MYRNSISRGQNPRRFRTREIQKALGIGSLVTVGKALDGLRTKLSIAVVSRYGERRYGVLYRVHTPKEILDLRAHHNLIIDIGTKRVLNLGERSGDTVRDPLRDPVRDPLGATAGDTVRELAGDPTGDTDCDPARDPETGSLVIQKLDHMYNHVNNTQEKRLSSGPATDDEAKLMQVRKLFDQLSGGGKWKDERDLKSFEQIKHISLSHIILGLSYSIARSPEHKMSSLAYAVPSILDHFEKMQYFSEKDLIDIAYKTMWRTLNCLETGKWTVPEWETGQA